MKYRHVDHDAELSEEEFRLLRDFVHERFGLYYDESQRASLRSRLSPRLDLLGAGIATTLVSIGMCVAAIWIAYTRRPFKKYRVLGRCWRWLAGRRSRRRRSPAGSRAHPASKSARASSTASPRR